MELRKSFQRSLFVSFLSMISLGGCGLQGPVTDSQISQLNISKSDNLGIIAGANVGSQEELSRHTVALFSRHQGSDPGGAICTGSLLPGNLVLTAAHCIDNLMVVVFSQDFDSAQSSQIFPVDKTSVSNFWSSRRSADKDHGDIALIHFQGTVPEGFSPVKLIGDASLLKNGNPVILAGYGVSHVAETPIDERTYPDLIKSVETGKVVCDDPKTLTNCAQVDMTGAGLLRKTTVTIADKNFAQSEILLDQTKGTGACHGDSGGPAYISVDGSLYLWGVTSRGERDPKNDCSQYAVYTNVLYYRDWIDKTSQKIFASEASVRKIQIIHPRKLNYW